MYIKKPPASIEDPIENISINTELSLHHLHALIAWEQLLLISASKLSAAFDQDNNKETQVERSHSDSVSLMEVKTGNATRKDKCLKKQAIKEENSVELLGVTIDS